MGSPRSPEAWHNLYIRWAPSLALTVAVVFGIACRSGAAAETIKIGATQTAAGGTLYLAIEHGYFAAEGIDARIVFLDPLAIYSGVVSGDLDFGNTGGSAAFFNLAGQGALKVIAASALDSPGFPLYAVIVSNRAYDGGLKSFGQLGGSRIAINEIGSIFQYIVARLAEKNDFDFATIHFLALHTGPNVVSAVAGGQVEAGLFSATGVATAVAQQSVKLLGVPGAEVPLQAGMAFTASKTADQRNALVHGYLKALAKGRRDYVAAFIGADGKPHESPTTTETLAIISKYVGQPIEQVKRSISYVDPEGRLAVTDILRQIAWYKSQGFVKPEVDGTKIIDMRYVVPLPDK